MSGSAFDFTSSDAQGTAVEPLEIGKFDREKYADYCASLDERCAFFWPASEGVLVCRRFRVPLVFAGLCRDMEMSLKLQLGALHQSMDYPMDIPNFLEPWYGIGAGPSAYGAEYVWNGDLAPATLPVFSSIEEALKHEPGEIEETPAGRHILEMIEYFLEKTGGKIPLSLSDVQSPLDTAAALFDTADFYMAIADEPENVETLLERIAGLTVRFCKKQAALIGSRLVYPGHGFSSSRQFSCMGFSDDNSIMLSPEIHRDICASSMIRFGRAFGGFAFHSCGNWSMRTGMIRNLEGLRMVDGAFTGGTDPSPNPAQPFVDAFAGTGITVNARMVGSPGEVIEKTGELKKPGVKLIAVTYCASAEEQKIVYNTIHS
ncbi:MAG: hypothetical protein LBG57_01230 [Treponema sp.]|jgi:hypothetical protein|nr:hypothetical protein [Treponema sp.]